MLTKIAEVDYKPEAECPQFHLFLDRMQPDKRMQTFLQVFHAYAMLIGGNGSQKIAYHYGQGANGKSAFLETLGGLAGSYRTTVSPETITGDGQQRQGQQASPDIARLFNTRLVIVEELPKGVPLKENLVKAMSGGSPLTARFLQKEFFEFVPIFVAVLSGNTKPAISGSDKGIWRRVFIIHWAQTIAEDDPSRVEMPELLKRFEGERAASSTG
jgi:putative DNA primase/helicase